MTCCSRCGFDPDVSVKAAWLFSVNRPPPGMNDRLVNSKAKSHAYRKERDAWQMELRVARMNNRIPKASARRKVTLTRVYGARERARDYDNYVGGLKSVVDALVLEGLLVGDSPAWVEVTYLQIPAAERIPHAMLHVLIEELG